METKRFSYYTGYEVDNEPSDDESNDIPYKALHNRDSNSESSSDEFDEPIRKFMEKADCQVKPKSKPKTTTVDEFDNEMDNELDQIYQNFISRGSFDLPISTQRQSSNTDGKDRNDSSTDDDDDDVDGKDDEEKPINNEQTNDDLLYDPDEEEEDEKWMTEQRIKSQGHVDEKNPEKSALGPTDAVLNCPGCMVLICHDCQRHETIKNQYRAMFVFHCKIDENRTVTPLNGTESNSKRKSKKNKRLKTSADIEINHMDDEVTNIEEILRPVLCTECGTEVGVYEPKEELYHFANILASH